MTAEERADKIAENTQLILDLTAEFDGPMWNRGVKALAEEIRAAEQQAEQRGREEAAKWLKKWPHATKSYTPAKGWHPHKELADEMLVALGRKQ